jgi:D-3-phosphoglycerate dehydrogenase / 2-oxoglutarate reductase
VAYDPYLDGQAAAGVSAVLVEFQELLETSDYVVIQVPLTDETRSLFDRNALARMKPGAVLVNTARGPVIDAAALYDALREGRLAGAALDDLPEEPAKQREWSPENPLLTLANCLVTPHVAYYSEESIRYARTFAAEEVARVLRGEAPRSPVNLEQLASPPAGRRRESAPTRKRRLRS